MKKIRLSLHLTIIFIFWMLPQTISHTSGISTPPDLEKQNFEIEVGEWPTVIAINQKTNMIYVGSDGDTDYDDPEDIYYDSTISVINGTEDKVIDVIRTNINDLSEFTALAVNTNTNKIYAADIYNDEISVIDGTTNDYIKRVRVGDGPESIAVNPNTNMIYVSERDHHTVSIINGSSDEVIKNIQVVNFTANEDTSANFSPTGITVNPATNKIYVANGDNQSVSVIDGKLNSVSIIPIGISVTDDIIANPITNKIYGELDVPGRVYVIDGNTNAFLTTIVSGNVSEGISNNEAGNSGIALDPNSDFLYLPSMSSDTLSVVNSLTGITLKVPVGKQPVAAAVNPELNKIYVTNTVSDTVSVIEGSGLDQYLQPKSELMPGIKLEDTPIGVETNPSSNLIYVASKDNVKVIDGISNRVTKMILTNDTGEIAFNPKTNKLYIANSGNGTLSIADGEIQENPINIKINVSEVGPNIGFGSATNNIYTYTQGNISEEEKITEVDSKTNGIVSVLSMEDSVFDISPVINEIELESESEEENVRYAEIYTLGYEDSIKLFSTEDNPDLNNRDKSAKIIDSIPIPPFPSEIAVNEKTNMMYVATEFNDSVSAIDMYTNKVVANIAVGKGPRDLSINPNSNMIYVAADRNDTVSVIDGSRNIVIANIRVGSSPSTIAINPKTNLVYIANEDSKTVSILNGYTNKLISWVAFDINPSNSGHIICNGKEISTNQYHKVEFGALCTANNNNGFQFSSWTENLGRNSSRTILTSNVSSSPFNSLLSAIGLAPPDESASYSVSKYGNFTANFQTSPPPLPPEFWVPLYGIIVSTLVGWSIPSIIGWVKSNRENRRLHSYHKRINNLSSDGKLDQDDIGSLDVIKRTLAGDYAKGKIGENHYSNMKSEISVLYEEIYKKKIDSVNKLSDNWKILDTIKESIEDAYAKGKIIELHYNLLMNRISNDEKKNLDPKR